ncbi:MAG: cation:proton antiporter [Pseudomonadota bacterium]
MFEAAALAVVVAMFMVLVRAVLGPTIYDRILSVNTFGTKTVLLLALWGYVIERPEFLDIAIVYALLNFIGTIAVLKFFESGDLGDEHRRPDR